MTQRRVYLPLAAQNNTSQMKMKILLFSIPLYICFIFTSVAQSNHSDHWIFVHYHKTGHDLARRLAEVFIAPPCTAVVEHRFHRRVPIQNQTNLIRSTDVSIVAAPDIQIAWNMSFLNKTEGNVKMVHFVRDPFDMVISAYLYHAQNWPPGKEAWLKYPTFDPCEVNPMELEKYADHIGSYYGNVNNFMGLIQKSLEICKGFYNQHPRLGVRGYSATLRMLSKEDGLILEAARSIPSVRGGDILRMATNAWFEHNTPNRLTYRIFLPEFSVGNLTQFKHSSKKLFTHLMKPGLTPQTHFWNCIDVHTAVQRSLALAYMGTNASAVDNSVHVTQGLVSKEERMIMKEMLVSHRVFGPILRTVQKILLHG